MKSAVSVALADGLEERRVPRGTAGSSFEIHVASPREAARRSGCHATRVQGDGGLWYEMKRAVFMMTK